jgi:hypothetical protein
VVNGNFHQERYGFESVDALAVVASETIPMKNASCHSGGRRDDGASIKNLRHLQSHRFSSN